MSRRRDTSGLSDLCYFPGAARANAGRTTETAAPGFVSPPEAGWVSAESTHSSISDTPSPPDESDSNELDGNAQCFGADLQLLGLDRGTAVLPTYATSLNYHDTKVMLPTSNGWKTPFPTDLDLGAQLLAGSLFVQNAASELDSLVTTDLGSSWVTPDPSISSNPLNTSPLPLRTGRVYRDNSAGAHATQPWTFDAIVHNDFGLLCPNIPTAGDGIQTTPAPWTLDVLPNLLEVQDSLELPLPVVATDSFVGVSSLDPPPDPLLGTLRSSDSAPVAETADPTFDDDWISALLDDSNSCCPSLLDWLFEPGQQEDCSIDKAILSTSADTTPQQCSGTTSSATTDAVQTPVDEAKVPDSTPVSTSIAKKGSTLKIIQEDGITSVKERLQRTKRGVRRGHLPTEKSATITRKRNAREVCIKCRVARSECAGGVPCQRCSAAWKKNPQIVHPPCLKAHFADIIESGSCNYISQRAIAHLTIDGRKRIAVDMPEGWSLVDFLTSIEQRHQKYSIRRRSGNQTVFTLDLAAHARFLRDLASRNKEANETRSFRHFINDILVDGSDWKDSVNSWDSAESLLPLLGVWNNEPCRATYDIVPHDGSPPRPLNVDDEADRNEIIIAAQVSRIVCRKLEIDAYRELQSQLNKLRFNTSEKCIQFLKQLGQILLTLRWRLSWWELRGDGRGDVDPERLLYVERVKRLTMVLYFYFFVAKRSIGSFMNPEGISGTWSNYADTLPMWDDFPVVEGLDAFEEWLEMGKGLVRDAGGKSRSPHML